MVIKNMRIKLLIFCGFILAFIFLSGDNFQSIPETGIPPKSEMPELPAQMAAALGANERVVKTFAELKDAIAANNGITTVYLGSNITMQVGGILVYSGKDSLEIVGMNPQDENQTQPYMLTDYASTAYGDTIHVDSATNKNVLVRDMKITGKNYYGSVSALDTPTVSGLTVTYQRVTYEGPQLIHHRQGSVRIIDCDVKINGKNGTSPSSEFSETKHLYFQGESTVESETTNFSIFWIPLGGSFDILDDSSLTVTSPNTSASYGVIYADGSGYKVTVSVGRRSVFNLTIANTVAPVGNVTISSLTVKQDGKFYITTTKAATTAIISVGGTLDVEQNGVFVINTFGGASYNVLDQRTGNINIGKDAVFHIITAGTHAALINLYGRTLSFNDPASVILYNSGNRCIQATTTAGKVYVNAEQINIWDTAVKSSFTNAPVYKWQKADSSNIWIDGTLAVGAAANFSSVTTNYIAGDQPGTAPSAASFNMLNARVLAFGRLNLTVSTPTTASASIKGTTAPQAFVRVSFIQGSNYVLPDEISDNKGNFSISAGTALLAGTIIKVKVNYQYLTAEREAAVSDVGKIELNIPEKLSFFSAKLSKEETFVQRLQSDWKIVVSDTKGPGRKWSVFARLVEPLTPQGQARPPLPNAIVFVDESGSSTPLRTDQSLSILEHTTSSSNDLTDIMWNNDKGILIVMPVGAVYSNIAYSGIIEWSLVEAP